MKLSFDKLDKHEARELLKALLIVGTYLDEQRESLMDLLRSLQVIEFSELSGLDQIEAVDLHR